VYSEDAHERVPGVASADLEEKNVAVIADTHTREVVGERVEQSLMDSGFRMIGILGEVFGTSDKYVLSDWSR
jgi:glycerol dehydrogenase-like iron-containing ADH family enzyme